ncbi:ABC transporter substrate-binding protein [Ramlibacter sp.]|uniref:ABC transporter substrate-binding protein n=1 Tax=Ramlibacter sp. TaxID=1917967 RepID=UPI003D0F462B
MSQTATTGLRRREALLAASAALALPAWAQQALPHGLRSGKPYNGQKLRILAAVAPQFDGLMLRSQEFTTMTGIEAQWDFVPFTALQDKIAAVGVAADGMYDIVNYSDTWLAPNEYWLLRLDPLIKRDGMDLGRYPKAFVEAGSFGGNVLGLPLRSHVQMFFYRADVFKELGLAPPKTWDDVIAAGKAIRAKRKDIEPLALNYRNDGTRVNLQHWLQMVWSNGGQLFDAKNRPAWTSEAALQATEFYIGLHTKEKIANPASTTFGQEEARLSFQQGKSAMLPMWWWQYSPSVSPKDSVLKPEQVGFTSVPTYKGKAVALATSMPFSISKHSKKQDAAWEYLKWLSNPDLDRRNAIERQVAGKTIQNNVVNHWTSLKDSEVNKANAGVPLAGVSGLESAAVQPKLREWPEVGDMLAAAIERGAAGGDVRKLMTSAAESASKVLKRAGYF